jgi:hypothetical protein
MVVVALTWVEKPTRLVLMQPARPSLRGCTLALQRRTSDFAQRGDRHHQRLEPAGCGLPLRGADPEEGNGRMRGLKQPWELRPSWPMPR